jgi:protein-tyrosine phosphatase
MDDGPFDVAESILMAARLAEFGYRTVCCTPHCIKGAYEYSADQVREATLMLQADLDNAEIELELWPGMEYSLDESFSSYGGDLLPLGDTGLVLCEAPCRAHAAIVKDGLELIFGKGFVPLIAHPERTAHFYAMLTKRASAVGNSNDKSQAPFWKQLLNQRASREVFRSNHPSSCAAPEEIPTGCLFQGNLGSFTGYYGEQVQRRAYELLSAGIFSGLASDLHDLSATAQVLLPDKIVSNPLLKKLAGWAGVPRSEDPDVLGPLFCQ